MRIGILQTGHAPDNLQPELGDYDHMFARLLDGYGFDFATWNVVDMEFPDGPFDADGWLITGSKHGVYEDHPWIAPLEALIRNIRNAGRPLVGVCFGHQIVAQALGGKVEKFAGGWSVGAQTYQFGDTTKTLNAWHQDQVVDLPPDTAVLASSDFCANAALSIGDHVLTVQAHPEFGRAFIDGLIRTRGIGVVPDNLLEQASDALDTPTDHADIAALFAKHFLSHAKAPA